MLYRNRDEHWLRAFVNNVSINDSIIIYKISALPLLFPVCNGGLIFEEIEAENIKMSLLPTYTFSKQNSSNLL